MKYARYDPETGEIRGFYAPEIHGTDIPRPNIEVTDEQWAAALEAPHRVVDGELRPCEPEAPQDAELRARRIREELEELDAQSTRAARAITVAMMTELELDAADVERLKELELRAVELRRELRELTGKTETGQVWA